MRASQNGHTEIVKCLIQAKESPDLQSKVNCDSILNGVNLFATLFSFYFIMILKCVNFFSSITSFCINYGDIVLLKNILFLQNLNSFLSLLFVLQDGRTALMLASQNGHTEIVKYLIQAKASPDLQLKVSYSVSQ